MARSIRPPIAARPPKCRSRRQPLVHGVSRPRVEILTTTTIARKPHGRHGATSVHATPVPATSHSLHLSIRQELPAVVTPLVFAPASSRRSQGSATIADLALIVLGGGALLIAIVLWFDNAQGGLTGNGAVQEPGTQALGHRSGQRAALSLELPVLSALRRALPPARLPGRVRGRSARQMTILNAIELRAQPRHRLPADPHPHRRPAGGRCWRRCSTSPRTS